MKIATVIGARPQFIKASSVSRALDSFNNAHDQNIEEVVVHTGQHYDRNMSDVFFSELEMRQPRYNLEVSQCSHGEMTGQMLAKIEQVLLNEEPDFVLVYGDTNSTLAGALAGAKLNIPIVHIEAGLRSFNNSMPEEINRVVTDRISELLFCPTATAVGNLRNEGIVDHVFNVGDVMYDVTTYYAEKAKKSVDLAKWDVEDDSFTLCTVHRAENTDNPEKLKNILDAVCEIAKQQVVVLPLHPRTRKLIEERKILPQVDNLKIIEPVSYFEMLCLESSADIILTDSGGVQKEAFFHRVPCITLREETEWVETVDLGANTLCGHDKEKIYNAWKNASEFNIDENPYGDGNAAIKVIDYIVKYTS